MYDPSKPYKQKIISRIEETWNTPYLRVTRGYNPVFTRTVDLPEIDHTDGIGTKGYYHWKRRTFRNAVLDALAMNLNDLALSRATPFKLQNHIMLPADDHEAVLEIVDAFVEECCKRKIAITGGETSIHNNIDGMEISCTVSGFLKTVKPNKFIPGDLLVGLRSSGIHSNGFTKVRETLGEAVLDEFTIPTMMYSDVLLQLNDSIDIHGLMHITGGAFTKMKDLLEEESLRIRREHALMPQPIFHTIFEHGVSEVEMYRTFNCGIGFILSAAPRDAASIIQQFDADIIGEVVRGKKEIIIESQFSGREITL